MYAQLKDSLVVLSGAGLRVRRLDRVSRWAKVLMILSRPTALCRRASLALVAVCGEREQGNERKRGKEKREKREKYSE